MLNSFSKSSCGPVLVTGGTGFLGGRLVERLLANNRKVTVLARRHSPALEAKGVRFISADLGDREKIIAACEDIETVFHVAAKVGVWGKYADYFSANVEGSRSLLDGCKKYSVKRLVYTSTPSVVYNGHELAGADESLPLTVDCTSPYPLTKAIAEKEILAANSTTLRTIALRPHLIWGVGDPHLIPIILDRARAGRLRIVGEGKNRVDMVHVENAVDAHLLAEEKLYLEAMSAELRAGGNTVSLDAASQLSQPNPQSFASGHAYFITNGEPVYLWDWINELLVGVGERPLTKRISLGSATLVGALFETAWNLFPLKHEPPMTRFIATELAKDHWFSIEAARRDLGYVPRISMAEGTKELISSLAIKPTKSA